MKAGSTSRARLHNLITWLVSFCSHAATWLDFSWCRRSCTCSHHVTPLIRGVWCRLACWLISVLYLRWTWNFFSTYSGSLPSLGVVTVGNRPVLLPLRTFVHVGMFPVPRLVAAVSTSLPIIAAYQIRYLFPSSRLLHHPALWWWARCFHCYWAVSPQLFY